MATFHADFDNVIGPIKPMHSVGQPPMLGVSDAYFHYLTEAHIPYSRQHDTGGAYGGNKYVDIPNVFRDFDADEDDPASYDFTFTDFLLTSLDKAGVEAIYRLGVTIENYAAMKAYRIFPPKDYAKWARICEHVIRHYNEGWADGYHLGITYWEIWNEPDGQLPDGSSMMWIGTAEQYFELYTVTAKHLKACFGDSIKVGGYASCGFYSIYPDDDQPWRVYFLTYFRDFFAYIKANDAPIDFFSWHSYDPVERTAGMADYIEEQLAAFGYAGLETQLNEWNNACTPEVRGTSFAAANAAAMLLCFQHKKTRILCFYDARIGQSMYGGLFNPITYKPFGTYYSFKAFGELYALGSEAASSIDGEGLYAVAATDGAKKAAMNANISDKAQEIVTDLPAGTKVWLIDAEHFMTEAGDAARFTLGSNQVAYLA